MYETLDLWAFILRIHQMFGIYFIMEALDIWVFSLRRHYIHLYLRECGGVMVERRSPNREVLGSIPTGVELELDTLTPYSTG